MLIRPLYFSIPEFTNWEKDRASTADQESHCNIASALAYRSQNKAVSLFGPVVDKRLQRSHRERESTKELVRLSKRPPPVHKPAANWRTRPQQPQRLAQPAVPAARVPNGDLAGGGFRNGRRTCLPAPSPDTSNINLWNILRNNIGKDLSKVSMPVELNEPLNTLQHLCEELEYTELLDKAAETEDPYERMVSSLPSYVSFL
ncbi:UNVERIFIED_CONTAM: hypothetical protein FKN15_005130 [Acipenser sinensis]